MHIDTNRTTSIIAQNVPEAAHSGFQASLQNLLTQHGLIAEKNSWDLITWKIEPTTDGLSEIQIVVPQIKSLTDILDGLSNLALEVRYRKLNPNQFKLSVVEQPALTTETTLYIASLARTNGQWTVHTTKTITQSETSSRRPAACKNSAAKTAERVRRMMANSLA